MAEINTTQEQGADPIVLIPEFEEGSAVVYWDSRFVIGDDLRIQSPNTITLPDGTTYDSFQQDLQQAWSEYIAAAREESVPTPSERKTAIRELLQPVKGNTDKLSPCFCKEPYADETAKIDNDSHEPVKMPDCPHIFGKCCIVQWLGDNEPSTCPMCRKELHLAIDERMERIRIEDGYSIIDYNY